MIVSLDGVDKLVDDIEGYIERFPYELIVALTEDAYANAKKNILPHTLYHTGTGGSKLETNLDFRVYKSKMEGEVYILNEGMMVDWEGHQPTNYALFVHFGTQKHSIKPKKKKALRWAGANGWLYSGGHEVSGIEADPFMYNALEETFGNLDQIFKRVNDGLQ